MEYQIITNGERFSIKRKWFNTIWIYVKRPVSTGNGYIMIPVYFDTIDEAHSHIANLRNKKKEEQKGKAWRCVKTVKD